MKKLISAALAMALGLSMAACGQTKTASSVSSQSVAASSEAVSTAESQNVSTFPVTVTDQAGREVTIASEPEKIVSGYYISSSALIALGAEDRMVGIEAKADKRPIYQLSAPELIELPSVGTAKEFNPEVCTSLEPDLVVLPIKLQSATESLVEMGIPVLYVNPESSTELDEMITLLGQATGTSEKAQQLLDFEENTGYELTGRMEESLSDATNVPSVYLAGNSDLLSTAGGNMYQSIMVAMAGGTNAAEELTDAYWADVSYEQLLAWDPEWIVLASDASYTVEEVLGDENLADCTAVKEGHVIQMPNAAEAWDSPVPSGILGSVWLAGQLHPDLVSEDYVNETIETFYQTFYGFDYAAIPSEQN